LHLDFLAARFAGQRAQEARKGLVW